MKKHVIFDLDGTLCNSEHRVRYIQNDEGKKDWETFAIKSIDDSIFKDVERLLRFYQSVGFDIVFITGRSDKHRRLTLDWLKKQNITNFKLHMRKNNDWLPDYKVKLNIAIELGLTPQNVEVIFEDRSSVVKMWRDNGFRCYQVANGDF